MRATSRSHLRGNWLPVLLSFALILALTVLICDVLNNYQRKQIDMAFTRDTQRVVVQMESQLRSHFEALLGVKGLYAAKSSVSRKDFQLFLGGLDLKSNHPGFQAIQFVRHVPGGQLQQFVEDVRSDTSLQAQGYPEFSIQPDVPRPDHYVIEFTEPMQGNEKAFGLDLASSPAHLTALELGRDSGRAVATERVKLVQDSVAQAAIVVRIPIYRNNLPQDTVAQRRVALLGFAALVYRIDDLMREVIDPQLQSSLRTRIYDVGYDGALAPLAHDAHNLLFDSDAKAPVNGAVGNGELPLVARGSLVVGQRAWAFDFVAKDKGRYSRDYSLIGAILLSGTVIAALFATLVAAWGRQRSLSAHLAHTVAELTASHGELSAAYAAQEAARQQATQALTELRMAQSQLIQSEKMASLGQLVANVAHEINTPIAAVKSSGQSIADALAQLEEGTLAFVALDLPTRSLFAKLLGHAKTRTELLSSREERALVRAVGQQLADAGIADVHLKASLLVQLNAQAALQDYLPLLRHPQCELILSRAHSMSTLISSSANINNAVERVTKIVFALKAYSRVDSSGEMVHAHLREGVELVLTIYQNKIKQGTELVRHFEDIPMVLCLPDELNQVWTNLIHNALQAMSYQGTLTVNIGRAGDHAVVSVGDTGCGIPEAIRHKIFDPFFTTKPTGEGSGLGLDIARKIVDKHKGRIEVQSEVGVGTTFFVYVPFGASAA